MLIFGNSSHLNLYVVTVFNLRLNLQSNPLRVIEGNAMIDLNQIVFLDLSNLHLTEVRSTTFKGLVSLRGINLAGNQLININLFPFEHIPDLLEVNISDNPYRWMSTTGTLQYQVISANIHVCCLPGSFVCTENIHQECPVSLLDINKQQLMVASSFVGSCNIARVIHFLSSSKKTRWGQKLPNLITLIYEVFLSLQPSLVILNGWPINVSRIRHYGDLGYMTCTFLAWLQMPAAIQLVSVTAAQVFTLLQLTMFSSRPKALNNGTVWLMLCIVCTVNVICSIPLLLDGQFPTLGNSCSYMFSKSFPIKVVVYILLASTIFVGVTTCVMYILILAAVIRSRKAVTKMGGEVSGSGTRFPVLSVVKSLLYLILLVFWLIQASIDFDHHIWMTVAMAANPVPAFFHMFLKYP